MADHHPEALDGKYQSFSKLKARYSAVLSALMQVRQSVETDANWSWAAGDQTTADDQLAKVDSFRSRSRFFRDFFLLDSAALRKAHGESKSLDEFDEMDMCVKNLEKTLKRIRDMSKARADA